MAHKNFEFYFSAFIGAFILGIIVIFVFSPPQKIIVKYPNPTNSNKTVYTNEKNNECYKVISQPKKQCDNNEEEYPYFREL
jgi:hypothetical protein